MSEDSEAVEELWVFGGTRVAARKKSYAWFTLDATDEKDSLEYAAPTKNAGPTPVVGGVYRVRVVRSTRVEKGKTIAVTSKYRDHAYVDRHEDRELVARLELAHRLAETELAAYRRETDAKRDSALAEAMEPLLTLATTVGPFDRDAFAVLVLRKLHSVWWR